MTTKPGRIRYISPPVEATRDPARLQQRREDRRFYGRTAWLKLRELKLSESPLCEACLKQGRTTPGDHVHHVESVKARPDLSLCLKNLATLCRPCHTKIENDLKRVKTP
jgi:5-methylcytosine-specific restriction protein A